MREDGEDPEDFKDHNDSEYESLGEEEGKLIAAQLKHKIDMRNMLGFLNQNLYHDYLNITNIMKLK